MSLIDKIKKARLQTVEVAGLKFEIRRPTELEMFELRGGGSIRRLLPFIAGWEGVRECDLINGGDPHPLPFDQAVCEAWLEDRLDVMGELVAAIYKAYTDHTEAKAQAKKN